MADETIELRTEYVRVDEIMPAVRNPRSHPIEDIIGSIVELGFIEQPIVDERTGRLVAGHGRQEALLEMHLRGMDRPPQVRVDDDGMWLAPVQRGWASVDDLEADRAVVALNLQGEWEESGLAAMLKDLSKTSTGLAGTGYTPPDLDKMLANLAPPKFEPTPAGDQPRLDVRNPTICPACGHSFHKA